MVDYLNDKNHISCCFTGHRPDHLPWGRDEKHPAYLDFYLRLSLETTSMIEKGCKYFYCGMAQGVDIMAAQIVLKLRDTSPELGIKLIAACPHPGQAARWSLRDKQLYQQLLNLADEVVMVCEEYTPYCFHRRNRYMVDRSDYIIAGFDGMTKGGTASTVAYAMRKGRQITVVSPV